MSKAWLSVCVVVVGAMVGGCDPTPSSNNRSIVGSGPSLVFESCAASEQCSEGLRCIEQTCRPTASSVVGEYQAALGRRRTKEKSFEQAIAAFEASVSAYESDKLKPPADVFCDHGRALILGGGDPQRLELAARVLHRCLLQTPVGSKLRRRAAELLALLDDSGLEPKQLAGDKLSDEYLKGAPAAPDTSELKLVVSPSGDNKKRSYSRLVPKLQSDEALKALIPCWEEYWASGGRGPLKLALEFKHSFRLDEYDDFDRTTLDILEPKSSGDGAVDAAQSCAREALQPLATSLVKGREDETRWQNAIVFTIAP
jgi:hypothetical protein